jgi:hypothetical protein
MHGYQKSGSIRKVSLVEGVTVLVVEHISHECSACVIIDAHFGSLSEILLQRGQVLLLNDFWVYARISLEESSIDGESVFILKFRLITKLLQKSLHGL